MSDDKQNITNFQIREELWKQFIKENELAESVKSFFNKDSEIERRSHIKFRLDLLLAKSNEKEKADLIADAKRQIFEWPDS